jgi:outer membrane protein TolC
MRVSRHLLVVASLCAAASLGAQPAPQLPADSPLRGGVPEGAATSEPLPMSLEEAIDRGLQHNLGMILGQEAVRAAEGNRTTARGELLPQIKGGVSEVRQKINLAAFGFTGFAGLPNLIGPFNVFDARAYISQSVFDWHAIGKTRAATQELKATEREREATRDVVVLVCANLYLQAVSGESRIAAVRAQLATAQALFDLARDRKQAGLAPSIDALRAEVQVKAQTQRLIVAENEAAKQKLGLSRAIGLPLGQPIRLVDPMPFSPMAPITPEAALERAYAERPDLKAAAARVQGALRSVDAARGEGLPTLSVAGDYGALGNDVAGALATYSLSAGLKVPVFEGGKTRGKVVEAEAKLRERQAELSDLRAAIYYEIQSVLLDVRAAEERVRVSESGLSLAQEQLQQAQDRFRAGIAENLDVVAAQESVARASEEHIDSLFAHNLAKAQLARAMGVAAKSYKEILRGRN